MPQDNGSLVSQPNKRAKIETSKAHVVIAFVLYGLTFFTVDESSCRAGGIKLLGDTSLVYFHFQCGSRFDFKFDFNNKCRRDRWCVYVVNLDVMIGRARASFSKMYIGLSPQHRRQKERDYLTRWMRATKIFLQEFGEDSVPPKIKGNLSDAEHELGVSLANRTTMKVICYSCTTVQEEEE